MQINRLPTWRLLLHNTLHTAAHSLPSHWKVDWNGIINFYLYSTDFTDLGHIIKKKKKVSYQYWQQHLQLPTVVALHPFVLCLTVIWNKALSLVLWLEKKGMQLLALFNSIPPTSWQGHGSCRRKLRLEAEPREGVCRFQGPAWQTLSLSATGSPFPVPLTCSISGLVLKDSASEPKMLL